MTGNTFGESIYQIDFNNISSIQLHTGFLGAGYIEIISHGMNNKQRSPWSVNKNEDPAKAENCFSCGRGGKSLLEIVNKKLNEIKNNQTVTNGVVEQKYDKFEEIKKYKELLDQEIITSEEFEQKKKELLS